MLNTNLFSLHGNLFSQLLSPFLSLIDIYKIGRLNKSLNNFIKIDKTILNIITYYIERNESFRNNIININFSKCKDNKYSILFYIRSQKHAYSFVNLFTLNRSNLVIELKKFYYILLKHYKNNKYASLKLKDLINYLELLKKEYNKEDSFIL